MYHDIVNLVLLGILLGLLLATWWTLRDCQRADDDAREGVREASEKLDVLIERLRYEEWAR